MVALALPVLVVSIAGAAAPNVVVRESEHGWFGSRA
jgi:hypothetical protein